MDARQRTGQHGSQPGECRSRLPAHADRRETVAPSPARLCWMHPYYGPHGYGERHHLPRRQRRQHHRIRQRRRADTRHQLRLPMEQWRGHQPHFRPSYAAITLSLCFDGNNCSTDASFTVEDPAPIAVSFETKLPPMAATALPEVTIEGGAEPFRYR